MDPFDALLNKTCTVLAAKGGAADGYGQPPRFNPADCTTVASGVRCRVSTLKGGGREFKVGKRTAKTNAVVFVRPRAVSEHNWLLIDGELYNILAVENPAGIDHHYELHCEVLRP